MENQYEIIERPSVDLQDYAMSVERIVGQVQLIQQVMHSVMSDGEHYGVIPGTDKPTLYKPGAEKLSLTFRLSPTYEIRRSDLPNGHREYEVICTLTHISTGDVFGQGVGSCSTMESKYRYRDEFASTGKLVPKDYWKNRDRDLLGGKGFRPWKNPEDGKWYIAQVSGKVEYLDPADYYNCVTPDTRILTHDLQWVPAGDITSGTVLMGVEENLSTEYARHLSIGEATIYGLSKDELYEITLEDGRRVKCNGKHRWLVKKVGLKGTEWIPTYEIHKEISERHGRPRHWCIMSMCAPWKNDTSKQCGYLAGLFDADGSLGLSQLYLMFAQQDNIVLSIMQQGLEERGFQVNRDYLSTQSQFTERDPKEPVYQLRILGGLPEQLRALGILRPPRLMQRWLEKFNISSRRLEGRGSGAGRPVRIVSIESIGKGDVVLLGTSCHTYIAEGLVCHNTVLKMAKKRAHVDAVLTATAASDIFAQDLEDMAENGVKPQLRKQSNQSRQSKSNQREPGTSNEDSDEQPGNSRPIPISDKQRKAIYAKAKNLGISDEDMKGYLAQRYKVNSSKELTLEQAKDCIEWLAKAEEQQDKGSEQ